MITSSYPCPQKSNAEQLCVGLEHQLYSPIVVKGRSITTPTPYCFAMKVCLHVCTHTHAHTHIHTHTHTHTHIHTHAHTHTHTHTHTHMHTRTHTHTHTHARTHTHMHTQARTSVTRCYNVCLHVTYVDMLTCTCMCIINIE